MLIFTLTLWIRIYQSYFFSLILISKIIIVQQLVTNVVKIIIYSLTLETKAQRNSLFFFLLLMEMLDKVLIEKC